MINGPQFYDQNDGNYYNIQAQQENQQYVFGAIRGVKPESNINLQNDQAVLDQKKEKCIEIFKSCPQITDVITKARSDPSINPAFRQALDPNSMLQVMFADKHFVNCKFIFHQYP